MKSHTRWMHVGWFRLAICLIPSLLFAQQSADLVFHNGKILTVDSNFTIAQGVAVTGNRITAVGSNADVLAMAGPNTLKIDLKGRMMIPGIVDTHRHMYSYAEGAYGGLLTDDQRRRYSLDWSGVSNKDDVINQIRGQMQKYNFTPGRWVYFKNDFPGGFSTDKAEILYDDLNQWELDKVTPNNPVALDVGIPDFNGFLLNKVAMDLLMGKHGDFIKKYGRFWVDSSGRPDGHLEPPASRLVLPYTYDRKAEDLAKMYKNDGDELLSMGITTLNTRLPQDTIDAYKYLENRGELTFRIGESLVEPFGNTMIEDMGSLEGVVGSGDEMMWVTGIGPTAVDGSNTRACTDQKRVGGAYGALDGWFPVGQCHNDIEYRGSPKRSGPIQGNYYRDWTVASAQHGVRFAGVHVAGDRGVSGVLNIMEGIQQQFGPDSTKNWAMDHCFMVNPKDFARLGKMKVFMSCYIRLNSLAEMAKSYGDQIANTFHAPAQSMIDAGVPVVFETDSNVYVWDHMQDFVVRKDRNGKVWGPQDRVDHPTILKMATSWAAEYLLKPDQIGTIEKGKLADLLVLDRDMLTIPDEDIHNVAPLLTVFDGKLKFIQPKFADEYNLHPAGAMIITYAELVKRRPQRRRGTGPAESQMAR